MTKALAILTLALGIGGTLILATYQAFSAFLA
jgi:hypothetical protein